jgi:hypothetical protein
VHLVTVDPAHGVVAAPAAEADRAERTVAALEGRGFKDS